ncbi:MAG: hypothetical protein DRJ35_00135 [Thermoprotei archaeon]|nr:MAG: hypothetical protein DRJ35_00135 [Thermoprotei archaeon]
MGLEVAVVGVGRWGKNHVRVLAELKGKIVDRLVIVDSNIARAREIAEKYPADAIYSSVEDLTAKEKNLDAAIIAVPTAYHYKIASYLLDFYNLFIEKPLASSIEEGFDLVKKSVREEKIVAVGHIERFNPIVNIALKTVKEMGEVLEITAKRLGPGPASNYTLNLGVAHDLLVHDVDIARLFAGTLPWGVFAHTSYSPSFPYEIEISAQYLFDKDPSAFLVASWRTTPKYKHRSFSIRLENAIIHVDYILRRIIIDTGLEIHKFGNEKKAVVHSEKTGIEISYLQEEPLRLELEDFLMSIIEHRKPTVDIIDGYIALKCIEKALESAKKKKLVEISWDELDKVR